MVNIKHVWALRRILFQLYLAFCILTVVGGFITAPLFTYLFFGDWRFWKYLKKGKALFIYAWRLVFLITRWENNGYIFSVRLNSEPRLSPRSSNTNLNSSWKHGTSCGTCNNCCTINGMVCPIFNKQENRCSGYNSFFWNYFNCGRFPVIESQISYYSCSKWNLTGGGYIADKKLLINAKSITK